MPVTIHWTGAQIRVGGDHHAYGDPYESGASVTRIDNTAYISCWVGPVTNRKQIAEQLRAAGCTEVAWERISADGARHWVKFKL